MKQWSALQPILLAVAVSVLLIGSLTTSELRADQRPFEAVIISINDQNAELLASKMATGERLDRKQFRDFIENVSRKFGKIEMLPHSEILEMAKLRLACGTVQQPGSGRAVLDYITGDSPQQRRDRACKEYQEEYNFRSIFAVISSDSPGEFGDGSDGNPFLHFMFVGNNGTRGLLEFRLCNGAKIAENITNWNCGIRVLARPAE